MNLERKWPFSSKTISLWVLAILTTIVLFFLFIGEIKFAMVISGIELIYLLILFFFQEQLWKSIKSSENEIQSKVIWFTGLSGSGKSTLGSALYEKLLRMKVNVEYLDGDNIRELFPLTGFSKHERDRHIQRVGLLASKLESNGVFVIASFISPYQETRDFVRGLCKNFVEIYLSTPIEICEQRDVKGLYAKARKGEIKQFTGIDDPYEVPEKPEISIDTSGLTVEESVNMILKAI